jgi:hypothetical protein
MEMHISTTHFEKFTFCCLTLTKSTPLLFDKNDGDD